MKTIRKARALPKINQASEMDRGTRESNALLKTETLDTSMNAARSDQFLIAALGTSSGGLEAFEEIFKHMPADADIAFLITRHVARDHASDLADLLERHAHMPVVEVRDNTKIVPNRVYIIPSNATLTIQDRALRVAVQAEPRVQRLDLLARQAADLIESKAVEGLREAEERLARELSATRQLQSVSALLIDGGTADALYAKILDVAVAIMHSDMASIQMLDEHQDALRMLAWVGFDPAFGQIFELVRPDTETSCSAARRAGHRVIVSDVENCDFISSTAALENHRKMGIRAVQSTPLFSRTGRLLGMISTHWRTPHTPAENSLSLFDILARQAADLIERKHAEEIRSRLVALVESSDDAIVSKDLNGIIQSWNSGAERLFGYAAQEAIGQPVTMLMPADYVAEETTILERIRRGERIEHYETVRRCKDGTLVDVSLTVSPIVNEHRQIVGASKIARNITERKRIEMERRGFEKAEKALAFATALREKEAELARVARALSVGELATSIAHEVNQPLAAIVTNAEAGLRWLHAKTPKLDEAQESLALIVRDGNRASEVILRIREFLKKDSQQMAPVDISAVVQEAVALVRADLLNKQISLRVELSGGLSPVRGDRIQLQQVILNLIMNGSEAIASVTNGLRELIVIAQMSGTDRVLVAVRDSGTGMDAQNADRIFDAFFTTKPTGMGLGLSISRSIIEAHGGRIWAVPNDGPGLTVQFALPTDSEYPS